MKKLGRFLLGCFYAAIPIVGWYALYKSFKRVRPGEITTVQHASGAVEIIEREGIVFRPFPGDSFGPTRSKASDDIDLGSIRRVRIGVSEEGAMQNSDGTIKYLDTNEYTIDSSKGEKFLGKVDYNDGNYHYKLGAKQIVIIRNGELGESYRADGTFVLLEAGKRILGPGDRFVKKVSVASDIVDLGALKIVTVKDGQVAIVNTKDGNKALVPRQISFSECSSLKGAVSFRALFARNLSIPRDPSQKTLGMTGSQWRYKVLNLNNARISLGKTYLTGY